MTDRIDLEERILAALNRLDELIDARMESAKKLDRADDAVTVLTALQRQIDLLALAERLPGMTQINVNWNQGETEEEADQDVD